MEKMTTYYEDGSVKCEGIFQKAGLFEGKLYYPSGQLKFEGKCNNKEREKSGYYGPSYPVSGRFYSEDGQLIYEGQFKVIHQGSLGYPRVMEPEGFGSISWR